jgi:hypothetical protein
MYTFKKPKNVKEAAELIKDLDNKPKWCIAYDTEHNQKIFEAYKNITFIYKDKKLFAAGAISPSNELMVIDLDDKHITETLNEKDLNEINLGVRQLELEL